MNKRSKKKLIRLIVSLIIIVLISLIETNSNLNDTKNNAEQKIIQNTPGLYTVTKFDDGDTIQVDMEGKKETVRFIGVDTPETHDPRKPIQCFGKAASNFTKSTIDQNRVRLESDPTGSNRDRYQRLLRYVYLPDGTLVNLKIIAEGYGFTVTAFPFTKMEEFRLAQKNARIQNIGLWSKCELEETKGRIQTAPEAR
ncbi:thermonuclease family protein [Candidatus Nomurabacteria bacterium]|nr:thermonuclease family protein [Candidatus Saccharibacteria bacterium]MCA9312708.1 thermonuclease family protein [Candidatus Saccharibacteria bacterium]MCB9822458.1 thermonuclease family protein [Candidatus Nomurabacteria bacterium]MDQ5969766.1 micrococcal nuclease [Patescibacteria group bacterium]